jgi:tetratricopeptide (TPR) repeat protein
MKKQSATTCVLFLLSVAFSMMAVSIQPVPAQTSKGIELYNAWDFKAAEPVLRESVKANPADLEAGYYLGLSVLMQDKHQEALELLLRVKEAKDKAAGDSKTGVPDSYQIQLALARTHLELKQNEEGWKNLEAASKGHADTADLHVYRGLYYLNLEKTQNAVKELEKAMNMDDNNAYAHYYAGHAYLRSGLPAKAVEVFKSFIQLAPTAPEVEKAKALVTALC